MWNAAISSLSLSIQRNSNACMKHKWGKAISLGLFLALATIFAGCATTGSSESQGMRPTISGYISTGAAKRF
jgi:hypothetical protein